MVPVTRHPLLVSGDQQFELVQGREGVVGRADPAPGFTPDFDLTPLDTERTLSRRHARVHWREDGVHVREETAARNGTFVNGRRGGAGEEVRLRTPTGSDSASSRRSFV